MAATSEVGIHHIQKQIENCDEIVENIDRIVPKIYKIRQQALAQKEYINDIQNKLLTSGFTTISGESDTPAKAATLKTTPLTNTLVGEAWKNAAFQAHTGSGGDDNTQAQKQVFQSLFKFKHEIGTTTHFTSEQIGIEGDRTHGLNLSDVVEITHGFNTFLSASNSAPAAADTVINKLIKKQGTPTNVNPTTGSVALVGASADLTNYESDATNGIKSIYTDVLALTASDKIVGFGLN